LANHQVFALGSIPSELTPEVKEEMLDEFNRLGEVFHINFDYARKLDGLVITFCSSEDAQNLLIGKVV
jgi:hypothetical protein